ncbi:MAG: cytochrome P450 [Planctomycetota bacterium]|nr:cytochrome P450 [Planctomycetota bacterium]
MDTLSRVLQELDSLGDDSPGSLERFIDHSYSAFEYMPFGGGHRRCIGAAFASYEMAIVLGTILKRYQLELVDSNLVVPKRRNVTIGPSSGVPIRVNKR